MVIKLKFVPKIESFLSRMVFKKINITRYYLCNEVLTEVNIKIIKENKKIINHYEKWKYFYEPFSIIKKKPVIEITNNRLEYLNELYNNSNIEEEEIIMKIDNMTDEELTKEIKYKMNEILITYCFLLFLIYLIFL